MSEKEMLDIIAENCLCVRRLPFETKTTYSLGYDETPKEGFTDSYWNPDDKYFKEVHGDNWQSWKTQFYKTFPKGRRWQSRVNKVVKGGWWYIKVMNSTDSTVQFFNKHDKELFSAPTLEEVIQKYLDYKNNQ